MFSRLGFHFGARKKRKVATKTISYERYGEILFQKVALCYLLHFVQDGSSKSVLEKCFLRKNIKTNLKIGKKTPIYSPLTPDQPPPKGGRYVINILPINRPKRPPCFEGVCLNSKLSNFQTVKLSNFQTFSMMGNLKVGKLSNCQT